MKPICTAGLCLSSLLIVAAAGPSKLPPIQFSDTRLENAWALVEQMISKIHDQQLRRKGFARVPCGASVLTTTALGAREQVEKLLAREVGDHLGAE